MPFICNMPAFMSCSWKLVLSNPTADVCVYIYTHIFLKKLYICVFSYIKCSYITRTFSMSRNCLKSKLCHTDSLPKSTAKTTPCHSIAVFTLLMSIFKYRLYIIYSCISIYNKYIYIIFIQNSNPPECLQI